MKNLLLAIFLLPTLVAFGGDSNLVDVFKSPSHMTLKVNGRFPTLKKLDVLFVVDDSGSMRVHQQKLAILIPELTSELAKIPSAINVGVLNTSTYGPDAGRLIGFPKYLSNFHPNFVADLQNRLFLGDRGHATESVFLPVIKALSDPLKKKENLGFYRDDADLALIFFTDAVDQSSISAWEIADFLVDLKKGNSKKISVSSVIVPSDVKDCRRDGGDWDKARPVKIEEFTYLLKGKSYNLCGIQKATFSDIGMRISPKRSNLPYEPHRNLRVVNLLVSPKDPTAIVVNWGYQSIQPGDKTGWTYDAKKNTLVLGDEIKWTYQPKDTLIEISFEI